MIWIEYSANPLKDNDGRIIASVEVIRDVTEQIRLTEECFSLRKEIQSQAQFENIITQSKKMKAIFQIIRRVAATISPVLINGESGTGKELIAKAILANSQRKNKPFITVNCSAIPENLLESELFGHVKGAFTGAVNDHIGLIEAADKGTLFLDEIGELPLSLQGKLLRFLQDGESRKVGDTRITNFDVRIITATNKNLEEAIKRGTFREDLFFRLSVIPVFLPPLRERREDIPLLANHLLDRLCNMHSRSISGISSGVLKKFMDYQWPGNIRELENAIEYALHLTDDREAIKPDQLPENFSSKKDLHPPQTAAISIEEFIRQTIKTLQGDHTEGQIAGVLGISRKNLWEKRKRLNIQRPGKGT